ncbi:MAG: hypothetical protein KatS3mg005_3776 [Bryobacteraceae bacterium]|nr:MAG: hypothetical protein KatS3mg005_3776 [Bryobacteraceae bacterium]
MSCYISTRNSRYYAAVETAFGQAAPVTAANRFSGLQFRVQQRREEIRRRDKTGTRTHLGIAGQPRKRTFFELSTYLYARDSGSIRPRCGALVEGALGAAPRVHNGGLPVAEIQGAAVVFSAAHGLQPGDAISLGGNLRIVTACPDATTAWISAPVRGPSPAATEGAASYGLSLKLPSISLYEYWTPAEAVQRLLNGCVVDEMSVELNGDFHELTFRGAAAGVIDNRTFEPQQGGLAIFPAEPAVQPLAEMPVPGHLGQAWAGTGPWPLETVAEARIRVRNNAELRWRDFGLTEPKCAVPGDREVTVDLDIYGNSSEVCEAIYASAIRREPIPLMVQMGAVPGGMCAIYIPNFIPAPPEFLDGEERLRWRLRGSMAQGTGEDELFIAFG